VIFFPPCHRFCGAVKLKTLGCYAAWRLTIFNFIIFITLRREVNGFFRRTLLQFFNLVLRDFKQIRLLKHLIQDNMLALRYKSLLRCLQIFWADITIL
jgi:hypothetical protein